MQRREADCITTPGSRCCFELSLLRFLSLSTEPRASSCQPVCTRCCSLNAPGGRTDALERRRRAELEKFREESVQVALLREADAGGAMGL